MATANFPVGTKQQPEPILKRCAGFYVPHLSRCFAGVNTYAKFFKWLQLLGRENRLAELGQCCRSLDSDMERRLSRASKQKRVEDIEEVLRLPQDEELYRLISNEGKNPKHISATQAATVQMHVSTLCSASGQIQHHRRKRRVHVLC
jgi:hypothetical protein